MNSQIPELNRGFLGIENGLSLDIAQNDPKSLQTGIQILLDIEAIKQLKHAYFRCIDTANTQELAELLHEQVTIEFIGGTYEWSISGRAKFVDAIRSAFNSSSVAQHNGHHPEIRIINESEATGVWHLSDQMWLLGDGIKTSGSAFYYDRYQKLNGRWLIRESRYHRLFEINEATPEPPLSAHYLAEHGKPAPKE